MKLLFIIPSYKPAYIYGGPIRSVSFLAESLVEAGHEVTVYTTMANGTEDLDVEPGKEYVIDRVIVRYFKRLTKGHSNFSPGLLKALNKNVISFDIVHIHSWWNLVTMPATLICRLKGVKPVISPRGSVSPYSFRHRRSLIKRLFHFVAGRSLLQNSIIHSTSVKEDHELAQIINNRNRFIIPNLLDLPPGIQGEYRESPYLKMIFLGRIDPAKNLELLLNVLTHNFPIPYQLTIVGEGSEEYTQKLKAISNGHKEIKWIGPVDGTEKFALLSEADILVLPSHTENFGNVVFEALSQGTPVAVSGNVGAKDYIIEHQLGWVVEGGEDAWRDVLIKIGSEKNALNIIRQRAATCIAHDFDKTRQMAAYNMMYESGFKRIQES